MLPQDFFLGGQLANTNALFTTVFWAQITLPLNCGLNWAAAAIGARAGRSYLGAQEKKYLVTYSRPLNLKYRFRQGMDSKVSYRIYRYTYLKEYGVCRVPVSYAYLASYSSSEQKVSLDKRCFFCDRPLHRLQYLHYVHVFDAPAAALAWP